MGSASNEGGTIPGTPEERFRRIDRRTFIGGASVLVGTVAIDALTHRALLGSAQNANALFDPRLLQIEAGIKPSFSIDVRRREDFLFLRVDGYNLRPSGQRLVRRNRLQHGRLVITFVPQHLTEEAYPIGSGTTFPRNTRALLAAPSRLAFVVPASGIPLTLDGLLGWTDLEPALVAAAARPAVEARTSRRATGRHKRRHRGRH